MSLHFRVQHRGAAPEGDHRFALAQRQRGGHCHKKKALTTQASSTWTQQRLHLQQWWPRSPYSSGGPPVEMHPVLLWDEVYVPRDERPRARED